MVDSANHHFLPQFYLRGFASNKAPKSQQKVWRLSKSAQPNCTEELIKEVGCEEHFHTITTPDGTVDSNSIETQLARLETAYSPIREKVLRGEPLSPNERHLLSRFVCLMKMRTPAEKDFVNTVRSGYAEAMVGALSHGHRLESLIDELPQYQSWPPSAKAALARRVRKAHAGGRVRFTNSNASLLGPMFGTAFDNRLIAIYDRMNLEVIEAPVGSTFVTGDQPVVFFDPSCRTSSKPGTGPIDADVEITFPLSRQRLLRFSWRYSPGARLAVGTEVDEFNRRTVIMAKQFLFAACCDEGIRRVVRENHVHTAGSHFVTIPLSDGRTVLGTRMIPVRPHAQ